MRQRFIHFTFVAGLVLLNGIATVSAQRGAAPQVPTPDVKPGSINSEDAPYPYPSRTSRSRSSATTCGCRTWTWRRRGPANGHTVVLLHGNNFGGFYFGGPAEVLRKEGFRVIVPDQIGYGRSSKPTTIPYNFSQWARNTKLLLDSLKIDKAMIVGHSMGGMLAARFATQYPAATERLVLYNPIGLSDGRFERPLSDVDAGYKRSLDQSYQSIRANLMRYVAHNPSAWNDVFETYAKVRYSWTLGAEWPRLAMVQTLIGQVHVPGSGGLRLGPPQIADTRVRRSRGFSCRHTGQLPGPHEVHRRHRAQRPGQASSRSRSGTRAASRVAGQDLPAARRVSERGHFRAVRREGLVAVIVADCRTAVPGPCRGSRPRRA